jgi:hypothetical protein
MTFLFAASGNAFAQAPTQPTLPQETVSLAMPTQGTAACPTLTTGSNCIRNVPAGDALSFKNAVSAATCGDTIVLVAGSTYSGNFTIPATSCSGWIVIETSALSGLPASGNRVGPSNIANMATISTPNISPAIQFAANSNHWRLIGLEITTSYVSTRNIVYYIVESGETVRVQSQLPAFLTFDRIYLHGLATTNTQHGMGMSMAAAAVVDSYCDEIHSNFGDSQCFWSWQGTGPFLFQNNFIQAGAEDIMIGDPPPAITGVVPSDITVIGNVFQKNLAWRNEAAPYNWVIKNLFELKNAQRVFADGNVFQYVWQAGQQFALIFRCAEINCAACTVADVTFTHNVVRHVMSGVEVAEPDPGIPGNLGTHRILIQNNVITDVNSATWGGGAWAFELSINSSNPPLTDVVIDHNDSFSTTTFLYLGDSGVVDRMQLTNNIGDLGTYGIFGGGKGSGTVPLNFYAPGYLYNDNVFLETSGAVHGYPKGTFFNTLAGVGFTSVTGTSPNLSGSFQLTSSSPYHNAGTDGKDIGVWDWTCLNHETAAALAGNFVPVPGCAVGGNLPPPPEAPTDLSAIVD